MKIDVVKRVRPCNQVSTASERLKVPWMRRCTDDTTFQFSITEEDFLCAEGSASQRLPQSSLRSEASTSLVLKWAECTFDAGDAFRATASVKSKSFAEHVCHPEEPRVCESTSPNGWRMDLPESWPRVALACRKSVLRSAERRTSPLHAGRFCKRRRPQNLTEFGNYDCFNRNADGSFSLVRSKYVRLRLERKFEDVSRSGELHKTHVH